MNNRLTKVMVGVGLYSVLIPVLVQAAAERVSGRELDQNRRLLHAADHNDIVTVKSALRMKADINAVNNKGSTALSFAALKGYEYVVAALIQGKADINVESDAKEMPLGLAIDAGHVIIADMLISAGAEMNNAREYVDSNGKTIVRLDALLQAATNSDDEMVRMLLAHKADVNKQNELGSQETALMIAAKNNRLGIVRHLIMAGADDTYKDICGKIALDYVKIETNRMSMRACISGAKSFIGIKHKGQENYRPCVIGQWPIEPLDSDKYAPVHKKREDAPPAYWFVIEEKEREERRAVEKLGHNVALAIVAQEQRVVHQRGAVQRRPGARKVVCIECPLCTSYNYEEAQNCDICGAQL